MAINLTPAEAADPRKALRELRRESGLDMETFHSVLMAVNFPIASDDLARYRDAGIDQVVLAPMKDGVVLETEEDLYGLVEELAESFVRTAQAL